MKKKHGDALSDLKAWRLKAGLRQVDLAHLLSTQTSKVSELENGRARPNLNQLLALSVVYGKPLEVLVAGSWDQAVYQVATRLRKMPRVSNGWKLRNTRAETLMEIGHRLETYNDGRA